MLWDIQNPQEIKLPLLKAKQGLLGLYLLLKVYHLWKISPNPGPGTHRDSANQLSHPISLALSPTVLPCDSKAFLRPQSSCLPIHAPGPEHSRQRTPWSLQTPSRRMGMTPFPVVSAVRGHKFLTSHLNLQGQAVHVLTCVQGRERRGQALLAMGPPQPVFSSSFAPLLGLVAQKHCSCFWYM